jgi:hypothetical protein
MKISSKFMLKVEEPHMCKNKSSRHYDRCTSQYDACPRFTKKNYHKLVRKKCRYCLHWSDILLL